MEIGDIVIAIDCATNGDGQAEHPALVTKVISGTEINCVLYIDSPMPNPLVERSLKHESVQATGKRFRLKGGAQ